MSPDRSVLGHIQAAKSIDLELYCRGVDNLDSALAAPAFEERADLRSLLDAAPGLIALLVGPDHVLQFANSAWSTIFGDRAGGRTLRNVLVGAHPWDLLEALDRLLADDQAPGEAQTHTIAVASPVQHRLVHLEFRCRAMRGPDGVRQGIVLEGTDVTARVLADQRQQLLLNEMAHRLKNTAASVLGIARLARGAATDLDGFFTSLSDRIVAMCRTQDLLSARLGKPMQVRELLALEFAPYVDGDGAGPVDVVCQDAALTAASAASLSMIVHELMTNALKHGALSAEGGGLRVRCETAGRNALLTWSETLPTLVAPMGERGFGSQLMERLAKSMGGRFRAQRHAKGLDVALTFRVDGCTTPTLIS